MPTHSLQEYLLTAEGTARFAAHAQRLLRYQSLLESALPASLRDSARVANLRQGKLIIHAANAAVAAKLRQLAPRFTDLFLKDGAQLTQIEVKVQAKTPPITRTVRESIAKPSEEREQALAAMTRTLPADSPLRGSLERLLQTLKER